MKHDVFISYKSEDIALTKLIAHALQAENISAWYAPKNLDNSASRKDFDDQIIEAIQEAKIIVMLLSDEALNSDWVKTEITYALEKKKFVIPFVVRNVTVDNGLSIRLKNRHWIDAYPSPEKRLEVLLNNIKTGINDTLEPSTDHSDERRFIVQQNYDYDFDFDFEEGEVLYEAKEIENAVQSFLISAANGNPKAKKRLCEIFLQLDKQINIIPEEMWEIIDKHARIGHGYANFLMHTKYYCEENGELISLEYLKKAMKDSPIPEVFLRLAIHYEWGMGQKVNHVLAMHYYEKAASLGLSVAYSYIGQIYEFGDYKFPKDEALAIQYYEKGVNDNDKRSMRRLCEFYSSNQSYRDLEKAKLIAQKAIDLGYNEGYLWLGNIFTYNQDVDWEKEAKICYQRAAENEVTGAYGSLAALAFNSDDKDGAFRWAKIGVVKNDSLSFTILGLCYERKDENDEALKLYVKQNRLFGSGAADIARLYLESNAKLYDEYSLTDLIKDLNIDIKLSREESLNYLLRIYQQEKLKSNSVIDNIEQKIIDTERLGAELGITEYQYKYGIRFFDAENDKLYNPYKGLQWLEKSAKGQHKESIQKLIDSYASNGSYPDEQKFDIWVDFTLANKIKGLDEYNLCTYILSPQSTLTPKYADFLLEYSLKSKKNNDFDTQRKIYCKLIKSYNIEDKHILRDDIYEKCIGEIKESVESTISPSFAHQLVQYVYPDFDCNNLESGTDKLTIESLLICYLHRISTYELDLPMHDIALERVYDSVLNDISIEEVKKQTQFGQRFFMRSALQNFKKEFDVICEKMNLKFARIVEFDFEEELKSPIPTTGLARKIRMWVMESLIYLMQNKISPFDKISISTTDEQILNIAEKALDSSCKENAMLLISFVEVMIETEGVIAGNYRLQQAYLKEDKEYITKVLNEYRELLETNKITHNLPEFTVEYAEKNMIFKQKSEIDDETIDFDRLLDEFINSQLNE